MKPTFVVIGFLLLITNAFINLGHWLSESANKPVQADLIVTLGGGTGEREQMAAVLYKAGYAKKILLTGMRGIDKQGYYQSPTFSIFS